MVQYITKIIVPYIEAQRDALEDTELSALIMDNFKGQLTPAINKLLEANNIHVCLLPPNMTDLL